MSNIQEKCKRILEAYHAGELGQTVMPEDTSPDFSKLPQEARLVYFTLPMALNYQRNSYALWEACLKTWQDKFTRDVFDIRSVAKMSKEELRQKLIRYKIALQPNKHIQTWHTIASSINKQWGSIEALLCSCE